MQKLISAESLSNYRIRITFADGFTGIIDVTPFIKSGISQALLDSTFYNKVFINEFNGLAWENGFDFCPNFLREYLENKSVSN